MLRGSGRPRAALVVATDVDPGEGFGLAADAERTLGHAAGWTCTVRRDDVVLRNPLGEGVVRGAAPVLDVAWLENVHHDGSVAVFLVRQEDVGLFAEMTAGAASAAGVLRGATVRADVDPAHHAPPSVGRNEPCHCGSGRKFKHCHGR